MYSNYSEIFSTLGYQALDVIFGIDSEALSEKEKKHLVRLVVLSENEEKVRHEIEKIMGKNIDLKLKKDLLLALLSKEF